MVRMALLSVNNEFPWPYVIRRSARAKKIIIKLCQHRGVVVVYPRYGTKQQAIEFMLSQRDWVMQHASGYSVLSTYANTNEIALPHEIELTALDRWYGCERAVTTGHPRLKLDADDINLQWQGCSANLIDYLPALRRWLKQQAQLYLQPLIYELSRSTGLAFSKVGWRFQKTLWGSCNDCGNISLNAKLLFLLPVVAKYVMIHELCHTRYMSHCSKFWDSVAAIDPNYRQHERYLRLSLWQRPSWVDLL